MELMQQVKGYSDSREEEELEDEATEEEIITKEEETESSRLFQASSNFNNNNHHIDFMDLSLATNNNNKEASSSSPNHSDNHQLQQPAEKEHMFDKVVTPSDVGKLNRLVIPKQHAEKYFPLDSTSNDHQKGLLLNFEDRNGKLWRFRYSYWNSSQSYVMTKGWSRFVKEKKLDAGDIVSFQRGVGELYRHRLYIDWRRRDHSHHHHVLHGGPADPTSNTFIGTTTPFFLPNNQTHMMMSSSPQQYSIRWGGRFYSLPSPQQTPIARHHLMNYNNNMYPFHQHHEVNSSGSGPVYYLRSTPSMPISTDQSYLRTRQQQEGVNVNFNNVNDVSSMIIDSVPVVSHHHHNRHGGKSGNSSGGSPSTSTSKRLRLFGVNMECGSSPISEEEQVKVDDNSVLPSSSARFGDQKEASMFF